MKLLDVVALKLDILDEKLEVGMQGTIVHIFDTPTKAYEVEFANEDGETIVQLALTPDQFEIVWESS